jgi:hypothetical protein
MKKPVTNLSSPAFTFTEQRLLRLFRHSVELFRNNPAGRLGRAILTSGYFIRSKTCDDLIRS